MVGETSCEVGSKTYPTPPGEKVLSRHVDIGSVRAPRQGPASLGSRSFLLSPALGKLVLHFGVTVQSLFRSN
eukprot:COSAG01_NODE_6675_length_3550_cov_106.901768_3_plen_72_part_00